MIQIYSRLKVADNSGARQLRVIQVMGGSKRRYAGLGDIVTASVREALPNANVKKGDVVKAVVVRIQARTPSARTARRSALTATRPCLINPNKEPRGTRIFGPGAARVA